MESSLNHDMDLPKTRDDVARSRFVAGLRAYVLTDVASQLREEYVTNVEPDLKAADALPSDGWAVHRAIKGNDVFKRYSSLRCTA